jgi:enoyl-CoA hydratase/carnithine racemase
VPATQFAHKLWPRRRVVRWARRLLGRWKDALPAPDPGFTETVLPDERTVIHVGRRPPLNLQDAAFCTHGAYCDRKFISDPEMRVMIKHSGLPWHYQVRDPRGELVLDSRGKPKRIAAAIAENEPLPGGFELIGPMRTFGAGADLKLMMQNPVNAIFTLKAAIEEAVLLWYSPKPMIFVAEGDVIAGWFEYAMCCNFVVATRHARFGAPEVKRGLTLPFGAHALLYRTGNATAQNIMSTGELITGEEAVRLGVADALVPDGEDAVQYAMKLGQSQQFHDRVQQAAILRQYGPPMRTLVEKSIANYVKLLRSPTTRRRIKEFLREDA